MSIITKSKTASWSCASAAALMISLGCVSASVVAAADTNEVDDSFTYNFGTSVSEEELSQFVSPLPDGTGLPSGSGTVADGEDIYAAKCMACHGAELEGGMGDRLIGGRGTLAAQKGQEWAPVKTVESYWPYATTLFDYVKRAMPFDAPGSLSNDEVYAVTGYILAKASIIEDDVVMDASTLPEVEMPNRDGFIPADR